MTDHPDPPAVEVSTPRAGVRLLVLNRPEARNAIDGRLSRSLTAAISDANAAQEIHVVVLTGRDPAFCAGADLNELRRDGFDRASHQTDCVAAVAAASKPVIGAINGPAVTGGLELALACDFLVASERAWFADTHARVRVVPGSGLTARLPQAIGLRRAKQMSLSGLRLAADRACTWGLVNEVVPHDRLVSHTLQLAEAVAAADPQTIGALRSLYDRGAEGTFSESMRLQSDVNASWRVSAEHIGRSR